MFILKIGNKVLCNDDDGYTFLRDPGDANAMIFATEEQAQKVNAERLQNRYTVMESKALPCLTTGRPHKHK